MPTERSTELTGWRRWLQLKLRFGLAKLPLFPVRYRLCTPGQPDAHFYWSRVMPFMDPVKGAFDFELYGWDVRELRFLRRYLRPGMTFVDIGAHLGLYAILAARLVKPGGRVLAFEPSPAIFRRLRWHLRWNAGTDVSTFACAVGASETTLPLYVPTGGVDTVSSLRSPGVGHGGSRPVEVRVRPFDAVATEQQLASLDLVKLDVEGAEAEVLAGAGQVIQRHQPLWLFEALDAAAGAWGSSGRALVDQFAGLGCALFAFTQDGWLIPHVPRAVYPLDSNCNLLAVPAGRLDEVGPFIRV